MWNVADTHCDALMHLRDDTPGLRTDRHVTLAGLRKGQTGMMTFAAFVGPEEEYGPALLNGLTSVDRYWRMVEAQGDVLSPVASAAQLRAANARGKIGALLSVEGGGILQGSLGVLRLLHRLGVRMFGLTWSNNNELGCGCAAGEDTGLTPLGLAVIAECNHLRMLIDVSHLSDKGFYQAWEASCTPIIASHSDARALCPGQKRNLTDDMLAKLGQKGGYVGVNFCRPFLTGSQDISATSADVVRHIEYMAEKAGVDHVGIGSDYDGIAFAPDDLPDCGAYPVIAEVLLRRNWRESDVRGVMGENFLRIFEAVCG